MSQPSAPLQTFMPIGGPIASTDPPKAKPVTTAKPVTKAKPVTEKTAVYKESSDFGQGIRHYWLDVLTILLLASAGLALLLFKLLPKRRYCKQHMDVCAKKRTCSAQIETLLWYSIFLTPLWGLAEILFCQIFIRNLRDLNNAIFGFLASVFGALALSELFHLAVTAKSISSIPNDEQVDPTRLWDHGPSSLAAVTFATWVFLFLYYNAKLKVCAQYHTSLAKLLILYRTLFAALVIAGLMARCDEGGFDKNGNYEWWVPLGSGLRIFFGAAIGTLVALTAYRTYYASLFDYRLNHIPLSSVSLPNEEYEASYRRATFSRRDQWAKQDNSKYPPITVPRAGNGSAGKAGLASAQQGAVSLV